MSKSLLTAYHITKISSPL